MFLDLYGGSQTLHLPKRSFRWAIEDELSILQSYFNIRSNNRDDQDDELDLNHPDFFPNWEWHESTSSWNSRSSGEKVSLAPDERWEMFLEVDLEYDQEVSH